MNPDPRAPADPSPPAPDRGMQAVSPLAVGVLALGLALLLAASSWVLGSSSSLTLALLAGGGIGALNLSVLVAFIRRLTGPDMSLQWAAVFPMKLGALAVSLALCIRYARLPAWGLAAGLSVSLVALIALLIRASLRSGDDTGSDEGEHVR